MILVGLKLQKMFFGLFTKTSFLITLESHQSFSSKFSLNFPLLLDQDHSISRLYGVWKERTINGEQKLAIERSHFVIDGDGRIIGAERNVSPDESAKKALKVVANANL